jgi:hypothetical protein
LSSEGLLPALSTDGALSGPAPAPAGFGSVAAVPVVGIPGIFVTVVKPLDKALMFAAAT